MLIKMYQEYTILMAGQWVQHQILHLRSCPEFKGLGLVISKILVKQMGGSIITSYRNSVLSIVIQF